MDDKSNTALPSSGTQSHGGGILFVITAPSGAGKTSLCWAVIKQAPGLSFSVSHTTRPPRPGEREGIDYHFVNNETFDRMIKEDRFLEWANVYGNRYGTSREEVERAKREGVDLLIEIDRQGARQIRAKFPEAVGVFVVPPSLETLRQRLVARGTDNPKEIEKRLAIATDELNDYLLFDYAIINDDFEKATLNLKSIICAERNKVKRQEKKLHKILREALTKQAAD